MAVTKVEFSLTKYVEPIKDQPLAEPESIGDYKIFFDLPIAVEGWKEIRVYVYVNVVNGVTTPVTKSAKLELRFMHVSSKTSIDYDAATLPWNEQGGHIYGYAMKPVIGKNMRIICHPVGLPPGPYRITVTYLLVR